MKGGDFTDTEIIRFTNRQNRLQKMGMTDSEADKLSERLVYRDRDDTDSRKLCLECQSWKNRCMKPGAGYCTIPTVLQNCDGFKSVVTVGVKV